MKVLIILLILATLASIFFQYSRTKDHKKLFISISTFAAVVSLAVVGNLTRQVLPIYMGHIILTILSWSGLLFYLMRDKYYWGIIFAPILTIGAFLILELLTGSGHELG